MGWRGQIACAGRADSTPAQATLEPEARRAFTIDAALYLGNRKRSADFSAGGGPASNPACRINPANQGHARRALAKGRHHERFAYCASDPV